MFEIEGRGVKILRVYHPFALPFLTKNLPVLQILLAAHRTNFNSEHDI